MPWRAYDAVDAIDWTRGEVPVIDLANIDPARIARGAVSAESGRVTGERLEHMTKLARAGAIDGITFAPLNKQADRKSTRLNSSHVALSRMPSSA